MALGEQIDSFTTLFFVVRHHRARWTTSARSARCRASAWRSTSTPTRRAARTTSPGSCPKQVKYPNVVLKYGMTDDQTLEKWIMKFLREGTRAQVEIGTKQNVGAGPAAALDAARRLPGQVDRADVLRQPEPGGDGDARDRPPRLRRELRWPPDVGQLAMAYLDIEGGTTLHCWFNPKEYSITKSSTFNAKAAAGKDMPPGAVRRRPARVPDGRPLLRRLQAGRSARATSMGVAGRADEAPAGQARHQRQEGAARPG